MTEDSQDQIDAHARLHGLDSGVNDGIRRLSLVEVEIEGFDVSLRHHVDITVEKFQEHNERLNVQAQNDHQLQEELSALRTRVQVAEAKLNTVSADLEHRIMVLESQMEQARGQIQGLTLGMVTFSLDDPSREKLVALLRGKRQGGSDDQIVPEEEGTSRR